MNCPYDYDAGMTENAGLKGPKPFLQSAWVSRQLHELFQPGPE